MSQDTRLNRATKRESEWARPARSRLGLDAAIAGVRWLAAGSSIALAVVVGNFEGALRMILLWALLTCLRHWRLRRDTELIVGVSLYIAAAMGGLGLYRVAWWADDAAHFIATGALAAAIAATCVRLRVLDVRRLRTGQVVALFSATFCIGVTLAVMWEMYEWTAHIAATYPDTMRDIACGGAGSLVGAALVPGVRDRFPRENDE